MGMCMGIRCRDLGEILQQIHIVKESKDNIVQIL